MKYPTSNKIRPLKKEGVVTIILGGLKSASKTHETYSPIIKPGSGNPMMKEPQEVPLRPHFEFAGYKARSSTHIHMFIYKTVHNKMQSR